MLLEIMPVISDEGGGGPLESRDETGLNNKLILLVIVLILFHIGAFVS